MNSKAPMKTTPRIEADGLPPIENVRHAISGEESARLEVVKVLRNRLLSLVNSFSTGRLTFPAAIKRLVAIESAMVAGGIERASFNDRIKANLLHLEECENECRKWINRGAS